MEAMLIEGIFAAVPTPFYPDERVYLRKMEANIARYSRSLLAGMVVLGSTGEALLLDDAESREVLRAAAEAAAPEKVLIAGVGRESVKATLDLAASAASLGYDAVLVRTPTYYARQLTPEVALHYFRAVADRSPLPVLLYNIPPCVPYSIPVEVVAELAQHPNIVGIKDSSGDVERIGQIVAATRNAPRRMTAVTPIFEAVTGRMLAAHGKESSSVVSAGALASGAAISSAAAAPALKTRTKEVGFQVLCGNEATLLASLEKGACGAVLAFAACAPQACQEVYLGWKEHNPALAKGKQELLTAAGRRIVGQLGVAGLKYACDFNGFYGGYARRPILPLTAQQKEEIAGLLAGVRN
jgi:dihydrodipicolinate synthase/N-acetylneuraminate lyase